MAGSLNHCTFIGNVTKQPEIRSLGQSGDKVASLTLAVNESWKDKNSGEKREAVEWVNVSVFGPLVGVIENYVNKGDALYIAGKMQTRKWQDQEGKDRYSTEIILRGPGCQLVMLGSKSGGQTGGGQQEPAANTARAKEDFRSADMDDEIPF
jgi:single-strand DNA-binding protein